MYNLFIVHTQYNLILACGLAKTAFAEDQNDLILFHDFHASEELLNSLNATFRKVMVLEGNVPRIERNAAQKMRYIKECNRHIREFMADGYARIWIVDDMCIPEMYALKCARRLNKNVDMAWLEDGSNAYFSNGVISGGMGATPVKRWIRKTAFSMLYGLGSCYDLGPCMGSHKLLRKGYFTFPAHVRQELADRECVEISDEAFCVGMQAVYPGDPVVFEENSLLIAMDKLDVYEDDLETVDRLIAEKVSAAQARGMTVYYKYHPREESRLPALANAKELDRTVALESYLSRSSVKTLQVIGIKSTALQTAKKMGHNTTSLIARVGEADSAIVDFYQKIGVTV